MIIIYMDYKHLDSILKRYCDWSVQMHECAKMRLKTDMELRLMRVSEQGRQHNVQGTDTLVTNRNTRKTPSESLQLEKCLKHRR